MSDDLISRKALLEELRGILNEPHNTMFLMGIGATISIIEHRETSFDKEKVIEKLKCECDNRLKNWEENLFWNENRKEEGVIKGLSMAITIVEKGGIE